MTSDFRVLNKKASKLHQEITQKVCDLESVVREGLTLLRGEGRTITDDDRSLDPSLEWQRLKGDAGMAFNEHFQVFWAKDSTEQTKVKIICPTFLRGPLTIYITNGRASGSY